MSTEYQHAQKHQHEKSSATCSLCQPFCRIQHAWFIVLESTTKLPFFVNYFCTTLLLFILTLIHQKQYRNRTTFSNCELSLAFFISLTFEWHHSRLNRNILLAIKYTQFFCQERLIEKIGHNGIWTIFN